MRTKSTLGYLVMALLGLALNTAGMAQTASPQPVHRVHTNFLPVVPSMDINTIAGNGNRGYLGSGVPALQAELYSPSAVAVDSSGNLYFADTHNQRIRKVSASGSIITTYAGNGSQGYAGDGDPADAASLNDPTAIAFDSQGNLYIADSGNNVIRMVTPGGKISTYAGNGTAGFSGDTGTATGAELWSPNGVGIDSKGNLYIADTNNCVIRVVNSKQIISTYAGVAPQSNKNFDGPCWYLNASSNPFQNGGYNGDGPATSAELNLPQGIFLDSAGNLYIADTQNSLVRMVSPITKNLATVAGSFPAGYTGDNGPALAAALNSPQSVALDSSGNLYIADSGNNVIREVNASTQYINTIAGTGIGGFSGDSGPAIKAQLDNPTGIALDAFANIYIADNYNDRIREVGAISPSAAPPTFSEPTGTYFDPLQITLSDATAGASIYYTTDGTTPATTVGGSTHLYAGTAIPVTETTTIRAIATAKAVTNSQVVAATYTIEPSVVQPVISPAGGTFSSAQTVKIADSTAGAVIYYTIDGTTPTAASPKYTAPFIVAENLTVQAIAIGADTAVSPLAWANFSFVGSPTVLAYPATAIATPSATLNAVINTLGISGSCFFQYGKSSTALTSVTAAKSLGATASPVLASAPVTGLLTKTTYYYQIVVTTKSGMSAGEILSFTTN